MEVLRDPATCPRPEQGTAVTIGAFDGVHRGHRTVIRALQQRAAEEGLRTAVVTFDRHPASVVRPESAPLLLTDLDQKLELLADCGVDYTLVIRFDEERSQEPAADFVEQVLSACLNAKLVAVGEDFHFGHGRSGNVALLREMGAELGFEVIGHELVDAEGNPADGEPVSSTRIRKALRDGDLAAANEMLGRPHEVRGVVDHGDKRARELGFRTANLDVPTTTCLPGRRHLRRLVRHPRRRAPPHGDLAREAPHVLRAGRRLAARGPPHRLRRRPLRPARPGAVRRAPARRAQVRLGRGPRRADGPRRRPVPHHPHQPLTTPVAQFVTLLVTY